MAGPALRTVVIAPLEYQRLEGMNYDKKRRWLPDTHAELSSDDSTFSGHRNLAYEWNRALVARQDRAHYEDCLRQVLQNAPNLRKVILVHRNPSITDQELKEICCLGSNWKSCRLDKDMHKAYQESPKVSLAVAGTMQILFNSSSLRAQELIMEDCDRTRDAWCIEYDELPSTVSFFPAHLRKLRLSVNCLPSEGQQERVVAEFLSRAYGLECLFLTCGRRFSPENRVDSLLSQCRLHKLRTLIGEGGTIQDMDRFPIFCGVRNLRHLALEDVRIKRSHWRAVIDGIKSSLELKSLDMNLLWDGKRNEEDSVYYIDGGNNVDNFLHSKGPHPFPENATAFRTIGSTKIFGVFRHGLPKGWDRPRVAQKYYTLYFQHKENPSGDSVETPPPLASL